MEEHLRGGDADLRRAAQAVLRQSFGLPELIARWATGWNPDYRDVLAAFPESDVVNAVLQVSSLDRWARLRALEELLGPRAEGILRRIAQDARQPAEVRTAAEEARATIRERGRLLRPTERRPEEEYATLLRPASGPPSSDPGTLLRPVEEPAEDTAEQDGQQKKKRRLRLWPFRQSDR